MLSYQQATAQPAAAYVKGHRLPTREIQPSYPLGSNAALSEINFNFKWSHVTLPKEQCVHSLSRVQQLQAPTYFLKHGQYATDACIHILQKSRHQ